MFFVAGLASSADAFPLLVPIESWNDERVIAGSESIAFAPDGHAVVYGTIGSSPADGLVMLRDWPSGKVRCAWDTRSRKAVMAFAPKGHEIAISVRTTPPREPPRLTARVWQIGIYDTQNCRLKRTFSRRTDRVWHLRFTTDGAYLHGTTFARMFIVNADTLKKIKWLAPQPWKHLQETIVFQDYDRVLASAWGETYATIYRVEAKKFRGKEASTLRSQDRLTMTPLGEWRANVAVMPDLSRDGSRFAYVTNGLDPTDPTGYGDVHAVIRNSETMEQTHTWFLGRGTKVRDLMFLPHVSDKVLSILCKDTGQLMIHDLSAAQPELLANFNLDICPRRNSSAISRDGRYVAVNGFVGEGDEKQWVLHFYDIAKLVSSSSGLSLSQTDD